MATTSRVLTVTPLRPLRQETAAADISFAIASLSNQLAEIKKELTSIKEIMVAIALGAQRR